MSTAQPGFLEMLAIQRWDDHRYYHHHRVNQALHFVSAIGFLVAYAVLFIDPALAALIGWVWSMGTRQSGHFFFEPQGFDTVNNATHEYKEAVKVGYNLDRKLVLIAVWAGLPLLLWWTPTLGGLLPLPQSTGLLPAGMPWLHQLGMVWLGLGVAGLLFRTVQLFFIRDVQTGLVWMTKILTDPFHDAWLYRDAPLAVLRGERFDPLHGVAHKPAVLAGR